MELFILEINFIKAGIEYLETLVDLRIEFIKDIHPEYGNKLIKKIYDSTIKYFKELFNDNSYIGFLGLNADNQIICTAGLLISFFPPLNTESCRKIGHILNFYTKPEYRKKGYGMNLMNYIKKVAREEGINKLVLNATKMGFSLYKKSGFIEPEDKAMILNL